MPRRQFVADVADLRRRVSDGHLPNVPVVLCDGLDESDEFIVVLQLPERAHVTRVRVLCGDADMYPNTNSYFLSLDNPDATAATTSCLAHLQKANGRRASSQKRLIFDMVQEIAESFAALDQPRCGGNFGKSPSPNFTHMDVDENNDADGDTDIDSEMDSETDSGADGEWNDGVDDDRSPLVDSDFDFNSPIEDDSWSRSHGKRTGSGLSHITQQQQSAEWPSPMDKRISRDLRAVISHGYRFGVLRGMTAIALDHLLSVAVRVSTLGLPRQTLLAWDLDPTMYIVLLIRVQARYTPYEVLAETPSKMVDVSFRIGKCRRYKPSLAAADAAFRSLPATTPPLPPPRTDLSNDPAIFAKIMISNSLNAFMSRCFLTLSKIRGSNNCPWADAIEAMRRQTLGNSISLERVGCDGPGNSVEGSAASGTAVAEHSFPLLAMQFAMDQVVNCTKYCQACHARMDEAAESIKPTVCSDDLCLFQYIQMGMGRSTEHEILSQPNVVDLLVGFCYAALRPTTARPNGAIRTYPENIGLSMLDLNRWDKNQGIYRCQRGRRPCFLLRDRSLLPRLHAGQWVAVGSPNTGWQAPSAASMLSALRHAMITEVDSANATVYLSHGTFPYGDADSDQACIYCYDTPFEDVPACDRPKALWSVLDTLPPIAWIRKKLEHHACTSLRSIPGVSPSAATLLEWIIATNRSCILQIECPELSLPQQATSSSGQPTMTPKWAQFSFLHGSPDAEARFQKAWREATENREHPTLLAWHGSAIHNWHSIVRTGLDYAEVVNGRSYGNGVYFDRNINVSMGYARLRKGRVESTAQWANSQFNLQSALSLNEIVNAPSKFASNSPHYVVPQRDWHQCRFLLVNNIKSKLLAPRIIDGATDVTASAAAAAAILSAQPLVSSRPAAANWFKQDPLRPALGPMGALRIPLDLMLTAADHHNASGVQDGGGERSTQGLADGARADMDAADLAFCLEGTCGPGQPDNTPASTIATAVGAAEPLTSSGSPSGSQRREAGQDIATALAGSSPVSSSSSSSSASTDPRQLRKAQLRQKRAEQRHERRVNGAEKNSKRVL